MGQHLVLIGGESKGGKSASLHGLTDPEGVIYLSCEGTKQLPFPAKFRQQVITDPRLIEVIIQKAEEAKNVHSIVIDSMTFMMDMYETQLVLTAADTQKAWGDFQQFFKRLIQKHVAASTKNIIFTAHVASVLNGSEHIMERKVPVKGALQKNGINFGSAT